MAASSMDNAGTTGAGNPAEVVSSFDDDLLELFRKLHTLKGLASGAGFGEVANHLHSAEEMVVGWQDGNATPTREAMSELCSGLSSLEGSFDGTDETPEEQAEEHAELSEMLRACWTVASGIDFPDQNQEPISEQKAEFLRNVNSLFRDLHTLKGLAKLSNFGEVVNKAHACEDEVRNWSTSDGHPDVSGVTKVQTQLRRLSSSIDSLPQMHANTAEELAGLLGQCQEAVACIDKLIALEDPVAPLLEELREIESRAKDWGFEEIGDRANACESLAGMWLGHTDSISSESSRTLRSELWGMRKCFNDLVVSESRKEDVRGLMRRVEACAALLRDLTTAKS